MDIGSVDSSRGVQQIQQLQSQVIQERASEVNSQQLKQDSRDSVELSDEAESALAALREKEAQTSLRADREVQKSEEVEAQVEESEAAAPRGGNINDLSALLNSGQAQKGELIDTTA